MGFRDDEVYAALTRALEHLNDATRAVREAEAAMMQPDPAVRTSEDAGGCSGEMRAHTEPPIYRWRPGEDDGWAGHTTDATSIPWGVVVERWDGEVWQPHRAP